MPMFREDDEGTERSSGRADSHYPDSAPIPIQTPPGLERWLTPRRLSEESIRTDLCEGPVLESPPVPATPERPVTHLVSDRAELIERLKRGESPTWISNRRLESLFHQNKASSPPRTPQPTTSPTSPGLLPAPIITPEKADPAQGPPAITSLLQEGLNIERPRSALHSGNFTPVELSPRAPGSDDDGVGDGSGSRFRPPQDPWLSASPPRDYTPFSFEQGTASYRREAFRFAGPSSLSSSLSSNFVYQPPTSPLVQSESNEELDLTLPLNGFNIDANSPRNPRRHTLNLGHSPLANASSHRQPGLRREGTHPYQAHQPRRSLNSTPNFALTGTSPQTPASFFRARRPSFSSEASPLQHASMVGSYEESILRGRMSTTPSKPLQFMAQIGVLGLGKCKASLRCPAHATLPFSAVFYNYASASAAGGSSKMEDGPSPYVGQIDLENGLPNPEEGQRAKRKLQSRYQDLKVAADDGPSAHESPNDASEGDGIPPKAARPQRASRSVKAPPGGAYRIPEKGQLQIIIKNPNKTAVKLFLVPYDLAGMEAGTKTFIRQRSYSAGPIIESEVPATTKDGQVPDADRPTLRYLIHLHICCPSKGRYYLYRSIRVVFANRVPDGKEKLRNEVTYPDPRFTPYKPTRVMHPQLLGNNSLAAPAGASYASSFNINSIPPGAALAAERAFRRRSMGYTAYGQHGYQQPLHQPFQQPPELPRPPVSTSSAWPPDNPNNNGLIAEPFPEPLTFPTSTTTPTMPGLEMTGLPFSFPSAATTPIPTPMTTTTAAVTTSLANAPTPTNPPTYDKLPRTSAGYGGGHAHGGNGIHTAVAEGLLSKRLRSLGVVQPSGEQQPRLPSAGQQAEGNAGGPPVL
ncbi:hypothetical protein C8A05DRAFT_11391 [Staphylotrichum tortipilum]|uniref:Atos-like conserved domain-containing protein n=1 Tax=Staphylotrichum tortipilum TaxID=2831512 RepID=A0AAN6MTN0_9PEZI|nr:hypothetical protein C8A05DRAFT_11391 [Staphylotrichum longicolle]